MYYNMKGTIELQGANFNSIIFMRKSLLSKNESVYILEKPKWQKITK